MKTPHKHAELIKAWSDGAEIEQRNPNICLTSMPPKPDPWRDFDGDWSNAMDYRIKPEQPKYPQTNMTQVELLVHHSNASVTEMFTAVANAAIARAIDDGQVIVVAQEKDHG